MQVAIGLFSSSKRVQLLYLASPTFFMHKILALEMVYCCKRIIESEYPYPCHTIPHIQTQNPQKRVRQSKAIYD